jgi:hypothetical protein
MKAYVATTGALFVVLAVVHIWRAIAEGGSTLRDPFFIAATVACATLALWAWRVWRKLPNG